MRRWALILLLWLPLALSGAEIVTVVVTVTNGVVGNTNTFTLNSSTRTATNTVTSSPGTLIRESNSVPRWSTNLWIHIGAYPVNPYHLPYMSASNVVNIRGRVNEAMSASIAGGWGTISYETNTVGSPTFVVRVPHTVEANTNRTHIASMLSTYLSLATNSLGDTTTFGSNYLTLATPQIAPGIKTWTGTNYFSRASVTNATLIDAVSINGVIGSITNGSWYGGTIQAASISGTLGSLTNGYLTNVTAESLYVTNLFAPGSGSASLGIGGTGSGASASGANSTALGAGAVASRPQATALGNLATAGGTNSVAIGAGAEIAVSGTAAIALGQNTSAFAPGSIAIGQSTGVDEFHTNSVAIGKSSVTTKTNQVMVGSSSHIVTVPGVLESGALTNSWLRGTNVLQGSLAIRRADHSALVNGDNAGVILGTNHWIRIVAGPTAAFTIHGLANGQDGLTYKLSNYTGFPMTLANQSGTEPTAGNRIITGKGANLVITNYPGAVTIIYDANAARWVPLGYTD